MRTPTANANLFTNTRIVMNLNRCLSVGRGPVPRQASMVGDRPHLCSSRSPDPERFAGHPWWGTGPRATCVEIRQFPMTDAILLVGPSSLIIREPVPHRIRATSSPKVLLLRRGSILKHPLCIRPPQIQLPSPTVLPDFAQNLVPTRFQLAWDSVFIGNRRTIGINSIDFCAI